MRWKKFAYKPNFSIGFLVGNPLSCPEASVFLDGLFVDKAVGVKLTSFVRCFIDVAD